MINDTVAAVVALVSMSGVWIKMMMVGVIYKKDGAVMV
jgi:hypothetical protein